MKTFLLSNIIFSLLFFTSVSLLALTPEETKTARKTWLKGYEYFEQGEKAFENEQLREAHAYLKESLVIFNDLKTKYPGWSSSMIEYRIKLCNVKLALIKKQLASKNIKITDNDVDKENVLLKNKMTSLEEEFKKIADATGGQTGKLKIESDAGAEFLTALVAEEVLRKVGGDKLGDELVEEYRKRFTM